MRRGVHAREWARIDVALDKAVAYGFHMNVLPGGFHHAITAEVMNAHFAKYHLGHGFALHRFKGIDLGPAHDHPGDFKTLILEPYVEEIYALTANGWTCDRVVRHAGSTHVVAAATIHRIVELPHGESWTLVHYGRHVRDTHFYRFGDVVEMRGWRQRKWRTAAP